MTKVSVVVPVYYNQDSLPELFHRLSQSAQAWPQLAFEFIFVDDGSGDRSFEVLQELAGRDPRVRVVKLTRNFGSNVAILAGIAQTTGAAVAFLAADLQDTPELLAEMITAWQAGKQVVFAVRRDRDDPWLSRLSAQAFNRLFHWLVLPAAPPTGIGFFLIDRYVADLIIQCEEKNAHLINLIAWLGFQTHLIFYDRPARKHGQSRWTFRKKIKYAIDTFVAFSYLPIRLASLTGIGLAFLGALSVFYVLFARFFLNVQVEGWASLMIVLLVVSGVQMTLLGILGEYLWRNLDQARKRPIFVIEKILEPAAALPPLKQD
jgi:glycosyltransferase involved in cell wall biosynthesis